MARRNPRRNAPCECGSGRKWKKCCARPLHTCRVPQGFRVCKEPDGSLRLYDMRPQLERESRRMAMHMAALMTMSIQ